MTSSGIFIFSIGHSYLIKFIGWTSNKGICSRNYFIAEETSKKNEAFRSCKTALGKYKSQPEAKRKSNSSSAAWSIIILKTIIIHKLINHSIWQNIFL